MFDQLLESSSARKQGSGGEGFLVSLLVHGVVLGLVLAIPVIFYQGLPATDLLSFLAAPPPAITQPPPPPPGPSQPPPEEGAAIAPIRVPPNAFLAPAVIPDELPPPDEELDFSFTPSSVSVPNSGVPSGIRGGSEGTGHGVPGWIGPSTSGPPPPPPPREERVEPIRQGGRVMASKLIKRVDPKYPPLARRTRIEGMVLIKILVDEEGNVAEAEIHSGHPMLKHAALDAIRQWKYSPTLLNGEPVPVAATATIRFRLNR